MIIGIATIKPMKKFENQFIGTKFLVLGIPLVPLQSYFIVDNLVEQGIEIGLYWKQVLKAYMIFIPLLAFIAVIGLSFAPGSNNYIESKAMAFLLLLVLGGAFVYFAFFFGKTTEEEKELRNLYGHAVGINALPEYLNYGAALDLQRGFTKTFEEKFEKDWRDVLKEQSYEPEQIPLLFVITAYQNKLLATPEYQKHYERLLSVYRKMLQ